ncbi:unnamed protein product [Blepharisma stoltei]|uniref:TmcB/TmcC TPR repeats domain-containing protein n=1 Tax=Blepharisma stoltei TaxID=1481888 RepID=A0AAU9K3V8_9CILI|nr:unnamed protein product [Blepharisma stoltei]
MLDELDISKKNNYTAQSQGLHYISPFEAVKSTVIDYLETFFRPKYNLKTKLLTQFFVEILVNSINCLQLITLLWYPHMNITGWADYRAYWTYLSIFSFDNIISTWSLTKLAFYISSATLGMCIISLIAIGAIKGKGWNLSKIAIYFTSSILGFMTSVGFVPLLMIFLTVAKYSMRPDLNVCEYSSLTADDLNLGLFGSIIGIISGTFLIMSALIYELFTADIRHSFANRNIRARADSNLDIAITYFKSLLVVLYIYVGNSQIDWYIMFFMVSSAMFAYLTFKFNSYYNPLINSIKVSKMFIISAAALSFLFGRAIDNSLVILLLCSCVIPLIFGIFMLKVWKYIKNFSFKGFSNDQHEFELQIRKILINQSANPKAAIDAFINIRKFSRFKVDKLFIVWEANYCAYTIKDFCLSRIKLAESGNVSYSIEGEIQEWRLKKYLNDNKDKSPVLNFLLYLIDLEKSRHADEHLCYHLTELWAEITARKPKLEKLEHLTNTSTELIYKAKKLYDSMIELKSEKVYELYGGLLQNILHEYDQGSAVLSKIRRTKSIDSFIRYEVKLTNYEEANGNMLISANKDNFGSIVFINDVGSQILKGRIYEILGNKASTYIPPPYSRHHIEYEKKFVENCTNPIVEKPSSLFFLDIFGFLHECMILLRLTSLDNYLYFMMSFKEVKASRQVALTSEDGLIYSHSEGFSDLITEPLKSLRNQYLSDLLPGITLSQVPLYEPILLNIKDNNLALVHGIKNFKSTDIHFVLLISDQSEIDVWLENNDILQLEYFGKADTIAELEHFESSHTDIHSDQDRVKFNLKASNNSFMHTTSLGEAEIEMASGATKFSEEHKEKHSTEDKSLTASSSYFTHTSSSQDKKAHGKTIVLMSLVLLKRYKWVLFFSVLVVISTNIAIAIYITNAVNHSRSINTFSALGNILFDLVHIAENVRKIDYIIDSMPKTLEARLVPLREALTELDNSHNGVLSNLSSWSYCEASRIVIEDLVPLWNFDDTPKIENVNLFDALQDFIIKTRIIINSAEKKSHAPKEAEFVMVNGVNKLYSATNKTINSLVLCEIEMIHEISQTITLLFVSGVVILGICFTILTVFILLISRKYNNLWQFIKQLTHLSYYDLKSACLDRLSVIHGIEWTEYEQDNLNRNKATQNPLNFNISKRYLWRLGIFVAFTIAYYLVVNFALYPKCEDYLIVRPKLLENYIHRRALIPLIDFWTIEGILANKNITIVEKTGGIDFFKNFHEEIDEGIQNLLDANHNLIKNTDLMSNELLSKLFETGSGKNFEYGTYVYGNILMFDSKAYSANSQSASFKNIGDFSSSMQSLEEAMTSNFGLIDKSSQGLIISQLDHIIYAIIAYSLLSVILFFLYFLPYIHSETKMLLKMQDIMFLITECMIIK